jgi:hypothetical protein
LTASEAELEVAPSSASPANEARMSTLPSDLPVTVTQQLGPDGPEVDDEKELPVPPNCDHVIISPGIEPQLSDTAAVKLVPPAATGKEVAPIVVVVVVVAGVITRPLVTLLEEKSDVSGP